MTSDIEEKCSVCLKTGTSFNIFTTYNINDDKEELYVEVIKNCFNIEITQESGFDTLCTDCIMKLGTAYTFKNDIIEAAQRLVALQAIEANIQGKESQEEYLDNQFENNYNLNSFLNPETGQISYTLDNINEVNTTENEPDRYLIDLENDNLVNRKEEETTKKSTKRKKKTADVVKENILGNIENETKVKQRKRVRKDVKIKETVPVIDDKMPDVVESRDNRNDVRKSSDGKDITEVAEDVVSVAIGDNLFMKFKPIKPSKANKPPPFTLDPGQLVCKECDQEFETNKALSTHMNVHYPDYVCNECGMVFASQRRMRIHKTQAHVEGPLTCKYCDKEFTNANTRNTHMWRVHTKTDPFKCSQCDERFKTYLKRLRHVREVHGNAVEYPCQYCDKKFAYAAYRTKHIRVVHLQVRPHKCPSCPFSFTRRRELDAHRASKHGDGEMKYQCDICSKRFYFKTALKFHVNLHSKHGDGGMKYQYDICSKRFYFKTALKFHVNIHRYSCNQCDAKFPKICQLETHRKSHETSDHPLEPLAALEPMLEPSLQFDELESLIDCSYWLSEL